jgi:hypothetical protein
MKLDDLLTRIRNAPGASLYAKIHTVVETVAKSPEELAEAWTVLAPWALRELDRRALKQSPQMVPIPIANTGERKLIYEWRRADFLRCEAYYGKAGKTLTTVARLCGKIGREFQNGRQTYKAVRDQLPLDVRAEFEKWAGVKTLAA